MSSDFSEPAYDNDPTPKQKGWFGRNALWFVPLVLFLVGSPFLCCGGCALFGWNMVKQPVEAAVAAMNASPSITENLGAPIESSMNDLKINNLENVNGMGGADIGFDASGPKSSARVEGRMQLDNGVWTPEDLTISCHDGTEFKLP